MPQLFLNNFQTQFIASVKAAPESSSPALELDYGVLRVSDGAAGLLLNPGPGNWYVLTAFKRSGSAESEYEVLHVTAVDNAVLGECRLTVLRGQEGTTPKSYVAGDIVELRLTAGGMGQYVQTTDARMSNSRAPTGAAGGVLSGTYPNPGFAQAMATAADLGGKVDKVAGKGLSANDYTNADMAKLAGIAEQATKNATDAQLRDRASHTGVQAIATVTGLQTALDAKAPGSHVGSGGAAHAAATNAAAGFMSAADKVKLDSVAASATANATDEALRARANHTGTQAITTIDGLQQALADKVDAVVGKGLSSADFTAAEKAKLGGIAPNATANAADAELRARANHTGTQAIDTVEGLADVLAGKQATLVSGVNLKTVGGQDLQGEGDIPFGGSRGSALYTASQSINKAIFGDATFVLVELWGGGASGGASAGTSGTTNAAGGEGGSYASRVVRVSDLATNTTLTIGAGGIGVSATATSGAGVRVRGNNGGNSSFGGLVAYGGLASVATYPSAGPSNSAGGANGGAGGGEGASAQGSDANARSIGGPGGDSSMGGGGGGGGTDGNFAVWRAAGVSSTAGNGGAGKDVTVTGQTGNPGAIPSGGGGGIRLQAALGTSCTSGPGVRGQARLTWW